MKLKNIMIGGIAALTMGICSVAAAGTNAHGYYPPERINCAVKGARLVCEGFNHHYLVEDSSNTNFDGKDKVFAFYSGSAYFTLDGSEAKILFTYKNGHHQAVRLRSANSSIKPDIEHGNWQKVQDDLYICKGGYMHCPVISGA